MGMLLFLPMTYGLDAGFHKQAGIKTGISWERKLGVKGKYWDYKESDTTDNPYRCQY